MKLAAQPAATVLDAYFLEARSKLLDLAAILDRIDRGGGSPTDPRFVRLRNAIDVLRDDSSDRGERVQQVFSLEYDANWTRPIPREW